MVVLGRRPGQRSSRSPGLQGTGLPDSLELGWGLRFFRPHRPFSPPQVSATQCGLKALPGSCFPPILRSFPSRSPAQPAPRQVLLQRAAPTRFEGAPALKAPSALGLEDQSHLPDWGYACPRTRQLQRSRLQGPRAVLVVTLYSPSAGSRGETRAPSVTLTAEIRNRW